MMKYKEMAAQLLSSFDEVQIKKIDRVDNGAVDELCKENGLECGILSIINSGKQMMCIQGDDEDILRMANGRSK